MRVVLLCLLALVACAPQAKLDPDASAKPGIAARTAKLEARSGLFPLFVDAAAGQVFLQLPPAGAGGVCAEVIYVEGLLQGLGSNPVGLDRGQLGDAVILRLRRLGNRVLFEQPNLAYRALSDSPDERRAVAESFASSILWSTEIVAADANGASLIDLSGFLLRDAHDVVNALRRAEQGAFKLDAARSLVDTEAVLAFPDNVEFEALLTFAGEQPGPLVRSTTPAPQSITLTAHHSFVRLPPDGYVPREFDPRMGSFAVSFADYASPIEAPLRKQWIVRHRLEKTEPSADRSTVKEPIVYYVDRGAPEPIRQALIDGARWWAAAFEAAGFLDAYRVEVMPEGAHPLDVRYNVIQWVHRSTRGWSYGGGVVDPRTGEMLKGHVSLGSLRVRQDRLIFEGLLGASASGSGSAEDPVQLSLARLRQLSAHEVGHTLGITHNFAASSYGDRESVMDYPAPRVHLRNGAPDLSAVYDAGTGDWDNWAIRWAYAQFASGVGEAAALEAIVRQGQAFGLRFLTEGDARPFGTAVPSASLWDNGADATAELREIYALRRYALDRFGVANVAAGQPVALLQEVFVPLYLHHRYQLEAAAKAVGGVDYRFAVKGEADVDLQVLPAAQQRAALEVVLQSLAPDFLEIDDATLALLLPRPFGYDTHEELFPSAAGPLFDPLGVAGICADATLSQLLHPARCVRLIDQERRDPAQLSLAETFRSIRAVVFAGDSAPRATRLREVVQRVYLERIVALASRGDSPHLRALAEAELREILAALESAGRGDVVARAHRAAMRADIERYLEKREFEATPRWQAGAMPPGSPIGCGG